MTLIVSISPVRVEADSRTFKQAASVARFGYESIVIEGEKSNLQQADLPFELRTMKTNETWSRKLARKLRRPTNPEITDDQVTSNPTSPPAGGSKGAQVFTFLRFLRGYFYHDCILPLRTIPKASLYYLHSPAYFPAVYLLSRRYGVPFIYDAHDFYTLIEEPDANAGLDTRLRLWFNRVVEKLCARSASAVVTVSEGVAELQRKTYGCRSLVLRNCQDWRLDREPRRGLREELGLTPDKFLIVTVGQAKAGQAITEALEGMRMLSSGVHLAFVGNNYEQHRESIDRRGLTERVHLVPAVKPYEVARFIRSADASLILYYARSANYANCLPNGLFQSVAAELPLIYPELPEIKGLAKQYAFGIPIDPQSPESISGAVKVLMQGGELRETYRRNLQRAAQELSWEKEETILRDLLATVLAQGKSKTT